MRPTLVLSCGEFVWKTAATMLREADAVEAYRSDFGR